MTKSVPASISEVAFDCPHCGAYTSQKWFTVWVKDLERKDGAPGRFDFNAARDSVRQNAKLTPERRAELIAKFNKVERGLIILEPSEVYVPHFVGNMHLSQCFACDELSVWVGARVLFPPSRQGPAANPDLPTGVADDYEEASRILNLSPRGAAALLRLAIQKLCAHLGEKGKNIDEDIASLVKQGLSPMVQKSLDAVRVIGNEAVHPGTLDLKDDIDTAQKLFRLVNIIAEQMISHPKHVEEIYGKLPEAKRKAIEQRDAKQQT